MANKKTTLPISAVFSNLFHGFPKLLLTNLLFAVPLAVFFSVFYFINTLTGVNSNFILLLALIPVFPFYAGVVKVAARIAEGEENIAVLSGFIKAVKENFARFLIHGAVFYLAVFFSYWSIMLYAKMGLENWIFFVPLVISIIIAVFFLFVFYYVPLMTVTFDISMKDIYKNSVLMSFGELKHNLIAAFGLFLLFVICSSVLICCGGVTAAILIATAVLVLFFVPSIAAFIINSAIYKRMYIMIVDRDSQSKAVDKKLSDKQSELANKKNKASKPLIDEELKKLNIDTSADGEEYIYYNGRMVKKSVLLKMQQEALESEMK